LDKINALDKPGGSCSGKSFEGSEKMALVRKAGSQGNFGKRLVRLGNSIAATNTSHPIFISRTQDNTAIR
jgi:hypothetical protein